MWTRLLSAADLTVGDPREAPALRAWSGTLLHFFVSVVCFVNVVFCRRRVEREGWQPLT